MKQILSIIIISSALIGVALADRNDDWSLGNTSWNKSSDQNSNTNFKQIGSNHSNSQRDSQIRTSVQNNQSDLFGLSTRRQSSVHNNIRSNWLRNHNSPGKGKWFDDSENQLQNNDEMGDDTDSDQNSKHKHQSENEFKNQEFDRVQQNFQVVPEPNSILLLLSGALLTGGIVARRRVRREA